VLARHERRDARKQRKGCAKSELTLRENSLVPSRAKGINYRGSLRLMATEAWQRHAGTIAA